MGFLSGNNPILPVVGVFFAFFFKIKIKQAKKHVCSITLNLSLKSLLKLCLLFFKRGSEVIAFSPLSWRHKIALVGILDFGGSNIEI